MCCVFDEHTARGDTKAAPAAVVTAAVDFKGVFNTAAAYGVVAGAGASACAAEETGWPFDGVEALSLFFGVGTGASAFAAEETGWPFDGVEALSLFFIRAWSAMNLRRSDLAAVLTALDLCTRKFKM